MFVANAGLGTNYFNLWLKAKGYSVAQTNVLPTAGNALSVVAAFFFGIIADRTGKRLPILIVIELLMMTSNVMLSVWNIKKGALLFAFYLSYVGGAAQPIIIVSRQTRTIKGLLLTRVSQAWGNELNGHDPNLRQLLVATGNIFTYTFSMFIPRQFLRSSCRGDAILTVAQWCFSQHTTLRITSTDTRF